MAQNNNILQELNELGSSLTKVTPQNIYTVPDGYFDDLAQQVMNRIKLLEAENTEEELKLLSPMLASISKQMPYSVPSGYFDNLQEKMMQSVREGNDYLQKESFGQTAEEEINTLSPLLGGLNKQMPYSLPQNYFETLSGDISNKLNNKNHPKVVSISSLRWLRYAAAAVVVGVIALGGFLYTNLNRDPARSFARFEKKLNKEIKKTSDKELNEFIQSTGLNGDEAVQLNHKDEVKDMLKDVPDTELKKFLEEIADPESEDDALIMN